MRRLKIHFFEPGNISLFNFGGTVYTDEGSALVYCKSILNFNYVLPKHSRLLSGFLRNHSLFFLPTLSSCGAIINPNLLFVIRNDLLHFPLLKERIGEVNFASIYHLVPPSVGGGGTTRLFILHF